MVNRALESWVEESARRCKPDKVVWCDGSDEEWGRLTSEAVAAGELIPLNPKLHPNSFLHRSAPNDVARTEHLTYINTRSKDDSGPTNNWRDPKQAYEQVGRLFEGAMKGRTMYVVPFVMGPLGSPFSKVGVEITDSRYVALNMRIMTRMGKPALDPLGDSDDFTRGLHSCGDLKEEHRAICHFPEDNTIWSVGSGYGGNALLGKKCLALRIASFLARGEGWLAEHMLIVGIQSPEGKITYIAAAFPSACGKTNLAMLVPPASQKGWRVWTVGDDIAWMRIGPDGRLWAVNPEAGFFGVAPGTSSKSNPNALATTGMNTIFTNVLLKPDGTVWWEGLDGAPPEGGTDWRGRPWTPGSKEKGAHPNSRFTAPAVQCPCISPEWENPNGVPISAILFGGRRARVAPLVVESFDWAHGVFLGATVASETTAAATGAVGVVRRDPMAMLPFCGYHMADYFGHWLEMGKRIKSSPRIFHVNWFRQDSSGKFLWPGFGENLRVLRWVLDRVNGRGEARETPIGFVPTPNALDLTGLDLSPSAMETLLAVDREAWRGELPSQAEFFAKFGERLPAAMKAQYTGLESRLNHG
ncbi:MAG: phosphoenolpyruvate carboxykinase (GTP) [Planctomycetes bacterium]|nr:phosphoenolpyruvate carboxykinase (GTP) [Planctomycetota bacterium]